eukprot:jgi/Ulvmu1/10629/UM066_0008.1
MVYLADRRFNTSPAGAQVWLQVQHQYARAFASVSAWLQVYRGTRVPAANAAERIRLPSKAMLYYHRYCWVSLFVNRCHARAIPPRVLYSFKLAVLFASAQVGCYLGSLVLRKTEEIHGRTSKIIWQRFGSSRGSGPKMQPTTLQITVFMALGLALIILFAITDIQPASTTTVSVSRPQTVVTTSRTVSQISQLSETYTDHQDILRGSGYAVEMIEGEPTAETPRVSVRVYVEALCPDSARFVVYDLASNHFPSSLWDIVDINYIFWGNVHISEDGEVECQHGAPECEINTLLQCALSIAAFTPAPAHSPPGQPPLSQSLLDCFFSQELSLHGRYPQVKAAASSCIAAAGLPHDRVAQCASEGMESDAARYARAATDSLQPPHTWVPWVTVDGIPINSQQLGEAAHVAQAVCRAYTGPDTPEGCKQFQGAATGVITTVG